MSHINHKDYGYIAKGDENRSFSIRKGQFISGYTVGVLHLEVWYPLLPGNVVNADTYDFPIRHKLIPNATQSRVHGGDPTLIDDIIRAGKELEMEGVRAICGACGYLGNFQAPVRITGCACFPVQPGSAAGYIDWPAKGSEGGRVVRRRTVSVL